MKDGRVYRYLTQDQLLEEVEIPESALRERPYINLDNKKSVFEIRVTAKVRSPLDLARLPPQQPLQHMLSQPLADRRAGSTLRCRSTSPGGTESGGSTSRSEPRT